MMRKFLCIVAALCLCTAAALAETERFTLRFDEGFALSLPKGWVSYPVGEGPIRYALGAGDGTRYLYILIQSTGIDSFDAMRAAIEANSDCDRISLLELNGRAFAAFIAPALNASGCATFRDGQLITFLFTPQDDSDFMLEAAEIMSSIKL